MNHHKMRFVWKAVNCHHPSFPNYFVNNYSHGGAGAYSMSSTKLTSILYSSTLSYFTFTTNQELGPIISIFADKVTQLGNGRVSI